MMMQINFALWTPARCRQMQYMMVDALDDMKLLQSAVELERWQEERTRILVG